MLLTAAKEAHVTVDAAGEQPAAWFVHILSYGMLTFSSLRSDLSRVVLCCSTRTASADVTQPEHAKQSFSETYATDSPANDVLPPLIRSGLKSGSIDMSSSSLMAAVPPSPALVFVAVSCFESPLNKGLTHA